jgi:RNA polymerase sigma-70 factor (ECF subfamily)
MRTETRTPETLFNNLILPHRPSLYGPAYALTRSTTDAEDLVQDTLVRAYARFETFRPEGSPRAWLHTIMRNLFFNQHRKIVREPKTLPIEENLIAPTLPSPERQVLGQMEGEAALKAIHLLPSEYREVLLLSDVEGLSYQDIAERLRIPIGTVRSRLSRGRKRIQQALQDWHPAVVN